MHSKTHDIFIASLKAGVLPAVLAPIFWPLLVFIVEGKLPDWTIYPGAALTISIYSLIIGIICCITLGFPTLLIMQKFNTNKPIIVSIVGLCYAVIIFSILGPSNGHISISQTWPLYMFLGALGAICGYIASYLSRPNKAL